MSYKTFIRLLDTALIIVLIYWLPTSLSLFTQQYTRFIPSYENRVS